MGIRKSLQMFGKIFTSLSLSLKKQRFVVAKIAKQVGHDLKCPQEMV